MINFFAVVVLTATPSPHSTLFISGPWAETACHQQVDSVTGDDSLSKLIITSGCIPESDLEKFAEISKSHDCVFSKRAELTPAASIAVFNCSK